MLQKKPNKLIYRKNKPVKKFEKSQKKQKRELNKKKAMKLTIRKMSGQMNKYIFKHIQ